MPFGATANPSSLGTLNAGDTIDITITFSGVTAETSGEAVLLFSLGSEVVTIDVPVTFGEPKPVVGTITTPAGLTAAVLSADDDGAVIRFTRS